MDRTRNGHGLWPERHRRMDSAHGYPAPEPRVPVESAVPVPVLSDVCRAPPDVAATLPLRVGDRVCWISDSGPETGSVGWIGKLPAEDGGRDWMVGVVFDNPVGSGNGCYRGHRLFEAKLNHASIVPITGLIRAEDFNCSSPTGAPSPTPDPVQAPVPPQRMNGTGRHLAPSSAERAGSRHSSGPGSEAGTGGRRNLELHTSDEEDRPPAPARAPVRGHEFTDDLSRMTPFHRLAYEQLAATPTPPATPTLSQLMNEHDNCIQAKTAHRTESSARRRQLPLSDLSNSQTVPPLERRRPKRRDKVAATPSPESPPPAPPPPPPPPPQESKGLSAAWTEPEVSVGSAVEVDIRGIPHYGVIRWLGHVRGDNKRRLLAGVEMEEDDASLGGDGDGTFNGTRYFHCQPGKALFVPLADCSRDRRFLDLSADTTDSGAFGNVECPVISGNVPPISVTSTEELKKLCGKLKGIQGHLNSCYLDATLFSMFAFTPVLDCLLQRPRRPGDIPEYSEVQRLLKEEIVNPLRSAMYVRADRVMKLRQMLETLSSVRGLTSEEKDPEEFLQSLLAQMLHADPFLRYSSGQESYLYQLIVEKDDSLVLPSVQQLFDQSFSSGDIKLKEIPSCLIVQMPRFGKDYKMYSRILPSMVLDVTDVIENSPRQCFVCGRLAEWECKGCFNQSGLGLMTTAYCSKCNIMSHNHRSRSSHPPRQPLRVPHQFTELREHAHIPRTYLELFAVVCIHTSHYVTFTKAGHGPDAGWVFFDSMADRKGEAHGYNIPEVVRVPDLPRWLNEEGRRGLLAVTDDKRLPEHARRLLCDGYMCFYQSRDVMMYR
ncbi:ubiquitin carboxyl-terminal hydrolase CYLD-like isoform X2 [Amphibalanus amphitrite]|uniref:ubiquitin carboxyl-terminal hydrolase CYLD-like isoform X2 n=1 Tax=Amphibalanus amphitrite TaxID=1232801 RepID=UPI001C905393|nr:ubiquitin carboxyl-terminal hydrolase CYLD-like isoform X2 [Amphibalanus amphitrite]XP_043204797.1 ubiquitin carboxyl-terminal hydrolase CYLD-like isoform X2 [Amphibalanus amphitrite]